MEDIVTDKPPDQEHGRDCGECDAQAISYCIVTF